MCTFLANNRKFRKTTLEWPGKKPLESDTKLRPKLSRKRKRKLLPRLSTMLEMDNRWMICYSNCERAKSIVRARQGLVRHMLDD